LRAPDKVVAMTQGAVEATMATEPFASKLLKEGIATSLACPKPGTSVTGVVYSGKFMKERPEAAKNFMVALMKGFREIQGQQFFSKENLQTFNKYTNVAPEVIKEMATYEWDPDLTLGTATLVEQQAMYMRYGALKYKTPLKPEQFVDERYIKNALSVLGPYKGGK
jgi:NitT/TauT family transport system substrate-binding protein